MLKTIVVALVALASPAAAKQWISDGCFLTLETTEDGEWRLGTVKPEILGNCYLNSWPIDSPEALLDCDDGSQRTMRLNEGPDAGTLIFNNVWFYPVGHPQLEKECADIETKKKWNIN